MSTAEKSIAIIPFPFPFLPLPNLSLPYHPSPASALNYLGDDFRDCRDNLGKTDCELTYLIYC